MNLYWVAYAATDGVPQGHPYFYGEALTYYLKLQTVYCVLQAVVLFHKHLLKTRIKGLR